MTYREILDYIYKCLPMYQRVGAAAYKANLNNTIYLSGLLGNPENNFKSIHIAGTNGKGSVSHLIASFLQTKGLRVGLYTSPHLKDFRERIKINGKCISKQYISRFFNNYKSEFDRKQLSFFEMTVGLAFKYFSDKKVDFAVIETGLGGRLDSTNIIYPALSVITNISYDHTNLLGDSLLKIAAEKAGIIKENIPIVIGETQDEIKDIFIDAAKKNKAKIYFADNNISVKQILSSETEFDVYEVYFKDKVFIKNLQCPLKGFYQTKNLKTALQAIKVIMDNNKDLTKKQVKEGFKEVINNTGLRGRWEILNKKPLTICDVAHNEAGIREVFLQVKTLKYKRLHIVFGMVNDKNHKAVLDLLPRDAEYYFCRADIPRAMEAKRLAALCLESGLKGASYSSVSMAFEAARKAASIEDLILVCGSVFVVGEII
ncbi:MAG: bifunctional folylpolyglutamate synthase/dihydrofolate synthase [Bacteroidales bacterium]|nr:bifunctional folylpolyglutamate synthase/dihydrofolate synthase [Bacteroidales bacterium]